VTHNVCPGSPKPGVNGHTSHTIRGKEAHENYKNALPGGYEHQVSIPGVGRPDAVNYNQSIVRELKPDNPRAIQRGMKQVE